MTRRYVIVVAALLVLVGVRVAVGVPQTDTTQTFGGQVDIAMGPDGRLLVLVDEAGVQPSDGLVDHAFRLQQAPAIAYSGPAIVTSAKGRLTVTLGPDSGWVFNVTGRVLPALDAPLTAYDVQGIAHLWGPQVHQSPATLFATLSSTTCSNLSTAGALGTADLAGSGCRDCDAGGPGMSGCSVDCGGSSCQADCGDNSFACCTCGDTCGCCSNRQINGAGHH